MSSSVPPSHFNYKNSLFIVHKILRLGLMEAEWHNGWHAPNLSAVASRSGNQLIHVQSARDSETGFQIQKLVTIEVPATQFSAVGERIAHSTKFIAILVEKAVEPLAPIRQARFKGGDGMSAAAKKGPRTDETAQSVKRTSLQVRAELFGKGSLIYNPSHYVHHLATTRISETKVSPWVDLKRKDMTSEHMFFSALRRFGEAYLGVHCVTVIRGLAHFSIALHHSQNTTAPNFLITIRKIKCYTPFTAQPGPMWKQGSCERVIVDVKDEVNNTTLGLYSFRVFVDCVWSAQKIALEPGPLLDCIGEGRPPDDSHSCDIPAPGLGHHLFLHFWHESLRWVFYFRRALFLVFSWPESNLQYLAPSLDHFDLFPFGFWGH
ncbi:hypothetical protein B0H14DRAFT_3132901 [Mycena olivaceomarginata]|nr:hypothetical protein B0H14DRAFT_3132901 [Mycena olivaceomarginata]